jgi:hypothetical protein
MKIEGACVVFPGPKNSDGYGSRGGRAAHRVAWIEVNGDIPDGLEVDHGCRNRACVNVDHLRLLTHRDNLLAGDTIPARFARRTECGKGHPYSGDNLFIKTDGTRACRTCSRERQRGYDRARKAT